MEPDEDLRAKSARTLVDEIDLRREELERRKREAEEHLELAFGAREPQPRRGRPPKGAEVFPTNGRGALDAGEA